MPIYKISGKTVLFIHIPKTGGTSVEKWLSSHGPQALFSEDNRGKNHILPCSPQHFHSYILKCFFDNTFIDYAFTIVRHPTQRALSEYKWQVFRNKRYTKRRTLKSSFVLYKDHSLEAWLKKSLGAYQSNNYIFDNHIRPQSEFSDYPGCEVFRFEDGLGNIMAQVANRIGISPPEATPHEYQAEDREIILSDQSRAVIERFYAQDYQIFNYDPADYSA